MKYKQLVIGILIYLPLATFSQIIVDTSLLNSGEKWKPKISWVTIANSLHKVSLGPLETVDIEKGQKHVTRSKEKSLRGVDGGLGIVKDYSTLKVQPFAITIVNNATDSIYININLVTLNEGTQTVFKLSRKDLADESRTSVSLEATVIQTDKDTTQWVLGKNNISMWNSYETSTWDLVSSKGDSILIYNAKGFRKKVYKISPPEGLVFIYRGKQIAAYQYAPRNLFLHKSLSEQERLIVGGAVITMLSTQSIN